MSLTARLEARARRLRGYAIRAFLQVAATALILFVILRVAAPALVSRHDDLSLWLAGALLLACPLVLIQATYSIWTGWRRFKSGQPAR